MSISLIDNLKIQNQKSNVERDCFKTISDMASFSPNYLPNLFHAMCEETGKMYVYNVSNDTDPVLGRWREYGSGVGTDETVKLTSTSTDAKYLNELIDNSTIEVDADNDCLIVKKIEGQTVTVAEINLLTGVTANVQEQINNLGKSMTMYGVFGTKADLLASVSPVPVDGNTAIVIADEDNNNKQMTYIYIASNSAWTQVAESSVTVRDFTTDPIDLDTETTGTLPKSKIDIAIARLADVLDKTTYRGTGDGIVKQADKLTGLTATISALNQAVTNSHTHSNKAVLDKIVTNGIGNGFLADNGKYISILHIGTTSPLYDSQIWIDNTDSAKPILKIYDGTDWIAISGASSGGTSITVDEAMSDTSTNPVQNKVIKRYVDEMCSGEGGGSATLSNDITTNVEVGGVPNGTSFPKGTDLEEIIKKILVKYFPPTATFSITPNSTLKLYGDTITSEVLKVVAVKNTYDITEIVFKVGSDVLETKTEGVANGGTFTYTYTPSSPISDTITFSVDVKDGTQTVSKTVTIKFCYPTYYGIVADTVTSMTANSIQSLANKAAVNAKGRTWSGITMTYGKLCYAYPKSFGALTSIKDANNVDYINSYTRTEVTLTENGNSVVYYCYLLTDAAGVTNFKQIYA